MLIYPHVALAAFAVTNNGTIVCTANTVTTATTNLNGAIPQSSDQIQLFTNGSPINATITSNVTVSGFGLQLIQGAGQVEPITVTNNGAVNTQILGNPALQIDGNGGLITYSGAGSLSSTSIQNGSVGLKVSNPDGGAISITTGAGTISGERGIYASSTGTGGPGFVTITTGTGSVTGTSKEGIKASTVGGPLNVTIGSGGVISTGLGYAGVNLTSANGDIFVLVIGSVIGGGTSPLVAPPGLMTTSNGAGNIVVDGSGTVVGTGGRGIWAKQSTTGLGGILITGTGETIAQGVICPSGDNPGGVLMNSGMTGCSGIRASIDNPANSSNIVINRSGNIMATSADINALTVGNGNITITPGSNVSLTGTYEFGIEAESAGQGSITVKMSGANSNIMTGGDGLLILNHATSVSSSAASTISITTTGTIVAASDLAVQKNAKNPTGHLAGISAGYVGGDTAKLNSSVTGTVQIVNGAVIKATIGDGIAAYNFGNGAISVTNNAAVTAPTGIALTSDTNVRQTITNNANITGTTTGIDLTAAGSPTTINQQAGVISGGILLSKYGDTINVTGGTIIGVINGNSAVTRANAGTVNYDLANTTTLGITNPVDVADINVNSGTVTLRTNVTVFDQFTNKAALQIGSINTRTITGNYTQRANGTLALLVGPDGSAQLAVSDTAFLGGALQLISLNSFQPEISDKLTLVIAEDRISGKFARVLDPFSNSITLDLVYGQNALNLGFRLSDFASLARTPNQRAAGNLLDQSALNPEADELISFLYEEPISNLPGDLKKISPEGLTAFYEISFSNANIQRLNLEGRLDDLRSGSNGFSSNVKVNGATVNLEDKATVDGKSSKNTVEQVLQPGAENRWGVWVTGFGDFVNVDADANANGYNFATGGVSLGIDYHVTDQLAIGGMGEYAHTWTSLAPSGAIDVNSGRVGLYATWYDHAIYLNGAIYGGHSVYNSNRSSLGGSPSGGTGGGEFSTFFSGGYDFHFGLLTIGPIASLQYTYVNIDGFSENGSVGALQFPSQSEDSLRTDLGLRASCLRQIAKVSVELSLKAAWEHEFMYAALPMTAGFADIPGRSATFSGPSEGHDSAIVSAGVSVRWTPTMATYVNYDGQLGRDRYDSNAVTGGVMISF